MNNKPFEIEYLVIPKFVFNNEKLNYMAAKVYAFIHNFKMEEFYYKNDRLAELFNCSESTITRAVSQLEEAGYISTRFDGRKRYITDNYFTQRVVKNDEADSANMPTLVEPTASATLPTLNEASTAELIRKDNKNNLGKFGEKEIEINDKGIMINPDTGVPYTGRQLKEIKKSQGWGGGKAGGFPQRSGFGSQPSSYRKKEYQAREKKGAHGEHII